MHKIHNWKRVKKRCLQARWICIWTFSIFSNHNFFLYSLSRLLRKQLQAIHIYLLASSSLGCVIIFKASKSTFEILQGVNFRSNKSKILQGFLWKFKLLKTNVCYNFLSTYFFSIFTNKIFNSKSCVEISFDFGRPMYVNLHDNEL